MSGLQRLDNDVLIHVFDYLSIDDVLRMRQVSGRMCAMSKLRIVWQHALQKHVLHRGFPFPDTNINAIDSRELETLVRRAYSLGQFWLTRDTTPRLLMSLCAGNSATGVWEVRFLPARPTWIITASRGIWSIISCWDTTAQSKIAEWSPRQTLITGLAVNSDPHSQGWIAVSMTMSNEQDSLIQVLEICTREGQDSGEFTCLETIHSSLRVMTLRKDLLAASDEINETHVVNWKTGGSAILWGAQEPSEHNFQHNRCLQVVFTINDVLVVRARSLETFRMPELARSHDGKDLPSTAFCHATARHQLGWIDGVSVKSQATNIRSARQPLWIIFRAESDDPWSSNIQTLDLYTLQPNPAYDDEASGVDQDRAAGGGPYLFPPMHQASWASEHGHLRCRDILVGPRGTALWIRPRRARTLDLTALDVHSSDTQRPGQHSLLGSTPDRETLVASLLPSPLRDCLPSSPSEELGRALDGVRVLRAFEGTHGSWTAVDYDEARGLIALGDSQGNVDILEL